MSRFSKPFSCTIIAVLLLGMCFIPRSASVNAQGTTYMSIVNPIDGSNTFGFTSNQITLGGTFDVNVTVTSVTDLITWQFSIGWDPTLITVVSFAPPSDNVFAGGVAAGGVLVSANDTSQVPSGTLVVGCGVGEFPDGGWSFNGTGTLIVLTMRIIRPVSPSLPAVTCPIQFQNIPLDTFLLNSNFMVNLTIGNIHFTPVNAVYNYVFETPPPTYSVTFTESGLPSGTSWTVTLDGPYVHDIQSSTTNEILFNIPNGVYSFSVTSTGCTASPASGNIIIEGTGITEPITFSLTYILSVHPDYLNTYQDWPITFEGRVVDQLGNGVSNAIVGIVDPLDQKQDLSAVTDDYGYFLYSVRATKRGSGPEQLEFSFTINSQTEKRNVMVNDASGDTNRLLSMWDYFRNSADFLPKDANGKIIGYAKYAGILDTAYPGKVLTEGQGYSMLRAVWMDDKPTYDAIRKWTDDNMWVKINNAKAYLGWCWDPATKTLKDPVSGSSSLGCAPDGDEDIALAAILAYYEWNDIRDKTFAMEVLNSFREYDTVSVGGEYYVSFGWSPYQGAPRYFDHAGIRHYEIDPSYMAPYSHRIFAKFDSSNKVFWDGLVSSSYEILSEIQAGSTVGLVPDFAEIWNDATGTHMQPIDTPDCNAPMYGYDAFRTMWRVALDVYYNSEARGYAFLEKPANFFISELNKPLSTIYDHYTATDATVPIDAKPWVPTVYGGDVGATLPYTSVEAQQATNEMLFVLRVFADLPDVVSEDLSFYQDNWVWFGIAINGGFTHLSSSRMDIIIHSPANLLVTDPQGRRVGFSPSTGGTVTEMPGASYSGPGTEPQTIIMLDPIHSNYNITLLGTATGSYTLTLEYNTSSSTTETRTLTGTIMNGSIQTYNMDIEGPNFTVSVLRHDMGVVDVTPYRSWVYESLPINVSVTVANLGDFNETATVDLYYNVTAGSKIGTETVSLFPHETETLTFTWNTASVGPGPNYTMTANATIPFDSDMTNNILDSTIKVKVRILGDVNGDGTVNMRDVADAVLAFNSFPGTPRWNPFADVNDRGRVDMRDIVAIVLNFNKHE